MDWPRAFVLSLVVIFTASASSALEILIDFESDTPGNVSNGFTSVGAPQVAFSDTDGNDLVIGSDPVITGGSQVLAGFFEDGDGGIRLDLVDAHAIAISLDFGNDDPTRLAPGDLFELVAYSGTDVVDVVSVLPNRNLLVDQSIGLSGVLFDAVELHYTGLLGATEIIDNVKVTIVPEPTAALLFGIGALVLRASVASAGSPRRRSVANGRSG